MNQESMATATTAPMIYNPIDAPQETSGDAREDRGDLDNHDLQASSIDTQGGCTTPDEASLLDDRTPQERADEEDAAPSVAVTPGVERPADAVAARSEVHTRRVPPPRPLGVMALDPHAAEPSRRAAAPRTIKPPTPPPAPEPLTPLAGGLAVIDELLRDRERLMRRIEAGMDLSTIARAAMITIGLCALALGAAMGFYRGGIQVLYAAVKLPLVLLLTAGLCAPIYSSLKAALGHRVSVKSDFALILGALALACLVSTSLTPLLLLGIFQDAGYHHIILMTVGVCGLGGVAGYVFFFRNMHRQLERGHRLIGITLLVVMALVSTQFTWIMRPYIVRPASTETPFLRPFEGSFLDAVRRSFDSARGIYAYEPPAMEKLPAPGVTEAIPAPDEATGDDRDATGTTRAPGEERAAQSVIGARTGAGTHDHAGEAGRGDSREDGVQWTGEGDEATTPGADADDKAPTAPGTDQRDGADALDAPGAGDAPQQDPAPQGRLPSDPAVDGIAIGEHEGFRSGAAPQQAMTRAIGARAARQQAPANDIARRATRRGEVGR